MPIFEQATRQTLRFQSSKGELTTEQLWVLPLQSKTGLDLDSVAKAINRDLKAVTEESFVATTSNPTKTQQMLKLDVVKHIIAVKQAENEAERNQTARKAEKEKLLSVLAAKDDKALEGLSREDLAARIAALG